MNILLDTHVALWAITGDTRLGDTAREWIATPTATIWVSVASLWEIAIKHALARGDMPVSAQQALQYFEQSGYDILSIQTEHVLQLNTLPAHHQDPFDRMLVAQALVEPMRLLTHDKTVAQYNTAIVLV